MKFPFIGGIIGLIAMHIVRIRCWVKLRRRYISEHEGWTRRHMLGIVIFDEVIWLAAFAAICAILVMVL